MYYVTAYICNLSCASFLWSFSWCLRKQRAKQPCLQHDQPAVDLGENMSYTPAQNLPAYRSVAARRFAIQC